MRVQAVSSEGDVIELHAFAVRNLSLGSQHPRGLDYYLVAFAVHPTLLLRAVDDGGNTIGALLASVENDHVLIGELVVAEAARGQGIGSALLSAVEDHARTLGQESILLGAIEEAEGFYVRRSGYEPRFFIQVDGEDSCLRMRELADAANVPVLWRECVGNQAKAILATAGVDKALQARMEAAGAHTQYLFRKSL